MSTSNTYPDAYLARFCTLDREDRAYADVDTFGTFSTEWRDKLCVIRTYIIACMESQAEPDDLFSAKLKTYSSEWATLLQQAKAAAAVAAQDTTFSVFSIPLERA